MVLYLIGAVMFESIVLSAVAEQRALTGTTSNAMLLYALMVTWFVVEYLYHEFVHLYTYDFFAERVGFKLAWGCLFFYPFFYSIGVHALVTSATDISCTCFYLIFALFIAGWIITRGANNQKYYFKINRASSYFGFSQPASAGNILACGWWGYARHFNYFGEMVQVID